jgi:hypothetical protein
MLLKPVERMDLRAIDDCARELFTGRPVVLSTEKNRSSIRRELTFHRLISEFGHIKVPVRESDDEFREFFARMKRSLSAPRKMMELRTYIETLQKPDTAAAALLTQETSVS